MLTLRYASLDVFLLIFSLRLRLGTAGGTAKVFPSGRTGSLYSSVRMFHLADVKGVERFLQYRS